MYRLGRFLSKLRGPLGFKKNLKSEKEGLILPKQREIVCRHVEGAVAAATVAFTALPKVLLQAGVGEQ